MANGVSRAWIKCEHQEFPTEAGWYAVRLPGDYDGEDGYVHHDFPDYTTFGEFSFVTDDIISIEGDEAADECHWDILCAEPDGMIAWFGPIVIPDYP